MCMHDSDNGGTLEPKMTGLIFCPSPALFVFVLVHQRPSPAD